MAVKRAKPARPRRNLNTGVHRNTSRQRRAISSEESLAVARHMMERAKSEGVACALCGGVAVQLYGFTRATRDVDFIASDLLAMPRQRRLSFGGEVYLTKLGRDEFEVDWIVRDDDKQPAYEAALKAAIENNKGVRIVTAEWLVILKYLAGRGIDQIDLMWLLREEGLVDRKETKRLVMKLLGRAAYWAIRDLDNLFLEADLLRARDERNA